MPPANTSAKANNYFQSSGSISLLKEKTKSSMALKEYSEVTTEKIARLYNSKSEDVSKISPLSPNSKVARFLLTECILTLKENARRIASELTNRTSNTYKLINHFKNGIIKKKTKTVANIKKELNVENVTRDKIVELTKIIFSQFNEYLNKDDICTIASIQSASSYNDKKKLQEIVDKLEVGYRQEFNKRFNSTVTKVQDEFIELLLSDKLADIAISECQTIGANAAFNKGTNTILIGRDKFKKNSALLIRTIGHELGHCIIKNLKTLKGNFFSENPKIEEHLCDFIGHKVIVNLPDCFKNGVQKEDECKLPYSDVCEKSKYIKDSKESSHPADSIRNIFFKRFFNKHLLQDNSLNIDDTLYACNQQMQCGNDNILNLIKDGDGTKLKIAFLRNPYLLQEFGVEKYGIEIIQDIISLKNIEEEHKNLISDILSANPDIILDFDSVDDLRIFYSEFLKENPYFLNRVNNIEIIADIINEDAKYDRKILEALPVVFNNENFKFPIDITKDNCDLFVKDALENPFSFAYCNISQKSLTYLLTEMLRYEDEMSYNSIKHFLHKDRKEAFKCEITDENIKSIAKFLIKNHGLHSDKFDGDKQKLLTSVLNIDKENGFINSAEVLYSFYSCGTKLKITNDNVDVILEFFKIAPDICVALIDNENELLDTK